MGFQPVVARSAAWTVLALLLAAGVTRGDPPPSSAVPPLAPPSTPPQAAPASDASASGASEEAGKPVPQVTIEAQRDLEHRLSTFVSGITGNVPRDEALRRWPDHTPICPRVVGLPASQGEFVLERLSQIAR